MSIILCLETVSFLLTIYTAVITRAWAMSRPTMSTPGATLKSSRKERRRKAGRYQQEGTLIGASGRGMVLKVSTSSKACFVPLSLTTYITIESPFHELHDISL